MKMLISYMHHHMIIKYFTKNFKFKKHLMKKNLMKKKNHKFLKEKY